MNPTLRTALQLGGVVVLMAAAGAVEARPAETFQPPRYVAPNTVGVQVREVFYTTPKLGWPHVLTARELRGLERETMRGYRLLYPRGAARRVVCVLLWGPQCTAVRRDGLAVKGTRIRMWEDGSARVRFFTPDND